MTRKKRLTRMQKKELYKTEANWRRQKKEKERREAGEKLNRDLNDITLQTS